MKELGNALRQKREELGLDLDKVHRATKIQEKYISAIEDGDESVFTAEIYYKSFVKSYSKFLGLNGEDLLAQYGKRKSEKSEDEVNEDGNKNKNRSVKKQPKVKSSNERGSDLKKLVVTVLIAGILCAAFLYMNKYIPFLDGSDSLSAMEQKKIRLREIEEQQRQKEQEARERRLQEVSLAGQKSKVEESDNKVLKPFPQVRSAVTAPAQTVSAVTKQQDRQELVINAVENVWIRVEGDGREVFQGTIVKGTQKTWKANDEFNVKIGYTPGVDVYFNGVEIDVDKDAVQDVNTLVLKRQQ